MTVTSPITRFPNINMVLRILYENNAFDKDHSLEKQLIAKKMNKTVAIVNNALAMLREINLVSGGQRYSGDKIFLMKKGKKLYEILQTNNKNKIKEFSLKLIKESNSPLYKESYKLLKREPQMSYDTLGRLIRQKIYNDKKPKSNSTYANIGRTIKDTFCGMGIIDTDEAKIRRRNIRGRFTSKLYANQRIINILKTVENFNIDNTWKIDIPTQFIWDRDRALELARILIDLNIAYYSDYENNILKLTDKGEELKNNLKNNKRKKVLRSILLAHNPVKHIISDLIELNKDFSSFDVGNLISVFNKKNWKPLTKYHQGIALIGWLKEADIIVESTSQFRYMISNDFNIRMVETPSKLDWSLIDDKQFEFLCSDLLESLDNFENVSKMGGPGDLKRDITATERIKTTFGVDYFKWLVQCKHYVNSKINPSEIPELTNAISTHDAQGLLLITCSELTPSLKIHLEKYNDNPSIPHKAQWIEKNKLEELLNNNDKIRDKYF